MAIPLKYYRNNLTSLINTLEMMSEFNIPNIVFSSSATVYGDLDTLPVPEDTPLKPATFPYGQTAAGIREKLSVFGDDYDTPNEFCVRNYIDINDLADATRANNVLGWHAHRELTETLRNAWNWQKNYQ